MVEKPNYREQYVEHNKLWSWRKIIDTIRIEIYYLKHLNKVTLEEFEQLRQQTLKMLKEIDLIEIEGDKNKSKMFYNLMNIRAILTIEYDRKIKQGSTRFHRPRSNDTE